MGDLRRILVVDDDVVARGALAAYLGRQPGFAVVGEAGDGGEAVAAYARLRPDVVLMDLNMPVMSGVEAIRRIVADDPEACAIALTTFDASDHVVAALRAGASGYLLKDCLPEELREGVLQALHGEMPLSPQVRRTLVTSVLGDTPKWAPTPGVALTPRQHELVGWLAQGLTNHEIAQRMHVSQGSVKQYLSQVGTRLNATNRTQILVKAVQGGHLDPRLASAD